MMCIELICISTISWGWERKREGKRNWKKKREKREIWKKRRRRRGKGERKGREVTHSKRCGQCGLPEPSGADCLRTEIHSLFQAHGLQHGVHPTRPRVPPGSKWCRFYTSWSLNKRQRLQAKLRHTGGKLSHAELRSDTSTYWIFWHLRDFWLRCQPIKPDPRVAVISLRCMFYKDQRVLWHIQQKMQMLTKEVGSGEAALLRHSAPGSVVGNDTCIINIFWTKKWANDLFIADGQKRIRYTFWKGSSCRHGHLATLNWKWSL